ncbi:MAG TPA: 50S ribosomal protein L3 [Myxococcota bacterium]|nr:50S ribosomal protein L3 [Myxococcota bacterium]
MALELIGRKLGMTQLFTESGDRVPVTVIQAGPCTVVQKKSDESDGYCALQLGFADKKPKHTPKAMQGHFAKAKTAPKRVLVEVPVEAKELASYELGQEITCGGYEAGQHVDVTGTSKGRGFTGVVKRHGFPTRSDSHGVHESFRHGGAVSSGTFPGRIKKGLRMAGHSGNARVTQLNLRVERVDLEKNLIYVRGAVPGQDDGFVTIRPTVKG